MSTQGWILIVGLRVLDIGLLVVWLVWFFRLRDADDGDEGGDDGGGGPDLVPGPRRGPDGFGRPVPQRRRRIRDHSGPPGWRPRRRARPAPAPLPGRVRRPRPPVPAHRRTA